MGKVLLFSQNEKYLIGVDNKNRVKLWNKSSFNSYQNINEFNQTIKSIALLENDLLAVGSCGINKLEIRNIAVNQSQTVANLNYQNECVNSLLSFKHSNKAFLLSGSEDTTIRLYDLYDFTSIQTLKEHSGSILAMDFSSYLSMIASSSTDNKIKIWTLANKQLNEIEKAHTNNINAIYILANGLIATASNDKTIKIWKKSKESTIELSATLIGHNLYVNVLIELKNKSLVSGSLDATIKVWNQINESTFECVATLNHNSQVSSLAIWGSSLLMSGHLNGNIVIRNQTSFVLLQTLRDHTYWVESIILLNNEQLVSGSSDKTIKIWQKATETSFELNITLTGHTSTVRSLVVLSAHTFASSSSDKTIRVWDQRIFKCIKVLNGHTDRVRSLAVVGSEYLISISDDKTVIVWDILKSFSQKSTTRTSAGLWALALISNDSFMTGDTEGSLKMWHINSLGISFLADLKQSSNETSTFVFYQNYLITGHLNGFIKIWELFSFRLFMSIKAYNSTLMFITSININERNWFASGSADNEIKIWDSSFKNIQTLSDQSGSIISLVYLNEIDSLISTSSDMKLKVYKTKDIQQIHSIQAHNRSVQDIAILKRSNLIATCSSDKTIKIWNDSALVAILTDHIDFVYTLEYSSKDNLLISSSRDTSIKLWNIPSFTLKKTLLGHENSVISLALIENESTLISGSCDNSIIIWNLTLLSPVKILKKHTGCVNALNIYNENKFLFSGSSDKKILVWEIDNGFKLINQLIGHEGAITSLKSFDNILASASLDKTIQIWYFSFFKSSIEIKRAHTDSINALCSLASGLIATASNDKTIKIWKKTNENSFQLSATLTGHTDYANVLIELKNNSLVSGSSDESIKVWNQINESAFECVATLNHNSQVSSLAIYENSLFISGHLDGSIQIRNQTSFVLLQTLAEHTYWVRSMIFLNNKNLASCSDDTKIVIWKKINETSFQLSKTLTQHTSYVPSLVILPNNRFASASWDRSIRVWDQRSLKCIKILNGHTDRVNSLVVLANEYLISISDDKTLIVWEILKSFSRMTIQTNEGLYSLALFADVSFITGDTSGSFKIWSKTYFTFEKGKVLNDLVSDLTFLNNGFLVGSSLDKTINIWDNSFQLWSSKYNVHTKQVLALKVKDNGQLVTSSQDGTVRFWSTDFFILNKTINIH